MQNSKLPVYVTMNQGQHCLYLLIEILISECITDLIPPISYVRLAPHIITVFETIDIVI